MCTTSSFSPSTSLYSTLLSFGAHSVPPLGRFASSADEAASAATKINAEKEKERYGESSKRQTVVIDELANGLSSLLCVLSVCVWCSAVAVLLACRRHRLMRQKLAYKHTHTSRQTAAAPLSSDHLQTWCSGEHTVQPSTTTRHASCNRLPPSATLWWLLLLPGCTNKAELERIDQEEEEAKATAATAVDI